MNIFLKVMKTIALNVKQSDSVHDLKTLVREEEGIQEKLQEVFFLGDRLNDEQKLIDCGIQDNSSVNLYVENSNVIKLYIAVVVKEKSVEIEAKSQDTIQNIKSKVCLGEGILENHFSLFYNGKKLKKSKTLVSLGINGNSTLQLVSNPTYVLSVNLKLPNGDMVKTEAELLSTVADFKKYIASITGIHVNPENYLFYEQNLGYEMLK